MQAVPESRNTRQRRAVLDALKSSSVFRSAQELHKEMQDRGAKVGLATVYRTLQMLSAAEVVDSIRSDSEVRFRMCGRSEHHHHLVCRDCGRSVEITDDSVERWAKRTAARHGFSHESHDIEIYGRCQRCTK